VEEELSEESADASSDEDDFQSFREVVLARGCDSVKIPKQHAALSIGVAVGRNS